MASADGPDTLAVSEGRTTHLPFIFVAVEGDRNLLGVVEMLCSLSSDHLYFELIGGEKERAMVRLEDSPVELGSGGGCEPQGFWEPVPFTA